MRKMKRSSGDSDAEEVVIPEPGVAVEYAGERAPEEDEEDEELEGEEDLSSSIDANSCTTALSPNATNHLINAQQQQHLCSTCEACCQRAAEWWCDADQAYFCDSCDKTVHSANAFSNRHERIRVCISPVDFPLPVPCRDDDDDDSEEEEEDYRGYKRKFDSFQPESNKMIKLERNRIADQERSSNESRQQQGAPAEQQLQSPASGIATDLGDAEALELQDIDLFLDEEVLEEEEEHKKRNAEEELEQGCLIVPPVAATCENLNELLSLLGRTSSSGFDPGDADDNDEARFDFAIRKNNVRLLPVIDGQDGDGFCGGKVKQEEEAEAEEQHRVSNRHNGFRRGSGFQQQQQQVFAPVLIKVDNQLPQKKPWLRLDVEEIQNCWPGAMFMDDSKERSLQQQQAMPVDSSVSDAAGSSDVGVVPDLNRSRKSGQSVAEEAGQVPIVHISSQDLEGPNAGLTAAASGGGREARVSRYREKRRTRLFSKKIRYEVRKLNAERRPRLKGRFVKRSPAGSGGGGGIN